MDRVVRQLVRMSQYSPKIKIDAISVPDPEDIDIN